MSATEWAGVGEHRDTIGIAVVEHSMHSLIVEPPCGFWLHIQFFDVMRGYLSRGTESAIIWVVRRVSLPRMLGRLPAEMMGAD